MGRPKGSKNKSTLLKEALQASSKREAPPPPVVVTAPVVVPPAERKPENMPVYRLAVHRLELTRAYYGHHKEIDERWWNKLERIHTAPTLSEAERTSDEVTDAFATSMMAAWARGDADGPPSANQWKKLITSRQGLIKMLQKSGDKYAAKIAEYEEEIRKATTAMETTEQPKPPWQTARWNLIA